MRFALVDGQRREALPKLLGNCPTCNSPMVPKCGDVKLWHWAHQGRRYCDNWWESETPWHRSWKAQFPINWQEVVHCADGGDRHIADVKTDRGWVLEFQHSPIAPVERQAREAFYNRLVWVVDGTRRKRDRGQFERAFAKGTPVGANSLVTRTLSDSCALLREWSASPTPVFLDFGHGGSLWWLLNKTSDDAVYVAKFPRAVFIAIHRGSVPQDFDTVVKELSELAVRFESNHRVSNRVLHDPLLSLRTPPVAMRRR